MYNLNYGMVVEYILFLVRNFLLNIISFFLFGWGVKVMFDLKVWKLLYIY